MKAIPKEAPPDPTRRTGVVCGVLCNAEEGLQTADLQRAALRAAPETTTRWAENKKTAPEQQHGAL